MPRLRNPESDDARAAFIAAAIRTATADALKGIFYIPADTVTAAGVFLNDRTVGDTTLPGFASLVTRRQLAEGKVTKEVGEAQAAEEALDTFVRDYIVVLGRRTFRVPHSVAVLDCHKLDHSATMPVISSREDRHTPDRHTPDAAFTVACLKRALNHLHQSQAGLEQVAKREALPAKLVAESRAELFALREGILRLMNEFRGPGRN